MRNDSLTKELSQYLANQLLNLGSDKYLGECSRIQFMIGKYPDEVSGGGMCKEALTMYFENTLDLYFNKENNFEQD